MRKYIRLILPAAAALAVVAIFVRWLPKPPLLEGYDFSTAFYDRNGRLLRLELTKDEKYRLKTEIDEIPDTAKKALLLYEDRWFYYHPGINPLRMAKALTEMLSGGRRQGASTITMQVARLVYHIDSSSVFGKTEQILRALQLELLYSKDEILEAYFNITPYGGNIEGIGAASLIYFDSGVNKLNLPQSVLLTVVPQNPVQRRLSSEKGLAEAEKAAARLKILWKEAYPESDTAALELPLRPMKKLPFKAPHLVQRLKKKHLGKVITTIDAEYQQMLEEILSRFVADNARKGVSNAAAMIVDYKKREVLASAGSVDFFDPRIDGQVDGTTALRSPGSVLKPFIYGMALEQGIIHPLSMLEDVPRNYGLYTPENFDHAFYGLVNATDALVYSRNVPAVDLLKELKPGSFYRLLERVGVPGLRGADFYGLALALGGAEVTMENLAGLYAMLGNYGEFSELKYLREQNTSGRRLLSGEAAYLVLKMLGQNPPPGGEKLSGQADDADYEVYWKTGTSYGYRDAWTAGLAGNYVIVVWVGNFDGSGNHHFIGRELAAPLFFKIVRRLDAFGGLQKSLLDNTGLNIRRIDICSDTGDIADGGCSSIKEGDFIPGVTVLRKSRVLRKIPVDVQSGKRACRHRPPRTELKWFEFWPSSVRKALAAAGIVLGTPPDFGEDCLSEENTAVKGRSPQIIFPAAGSTILFRSRDGDKREIPLRASADADVRKIYWFVNQRLAGETVPGGTLPAEVSFGSNAIKAVDDLGRETEIRIYVKSAD